MRKRKKKKQIITTLYNCTAGHGPRRGWILREIEEEIGMRKRKKQNYNNSVQLYCRAWDEKGFYIKREKEIVARN